ncbi:MAG TPA: hypothetical protein VMU71_06085 [Terracidiphilus sp.]|nr:hypothetical protein [Terracidiphilus sp.]
MGSSTAKPELVHKHLRLDGKKLKRVQKALHATTETEAVERALDLVLSEQERNRIVEKAHREFFGSGIRIRDVYGALER